MASRPKDGRAIKFSQLFMVVPVSNTNYPSTGMARAWSFHCPLLVFECPHEKRVASGALPIWWRIDGTARKRALKAKPGGAWLPGLRRRPAPDQSGGLNKVRRTVEAGR